MSVRDERSSDKGTVTARGYTVTLLNQMRSSHHLLVEYKPGHGNILQTTIHYGNYVAAHTKMVMLLQSSLSLVPNLPSCARLFSWTLVSNSSTLFSSNISELVDLRDVSQSQSDGTLAVNHASNCELARVLVVEALVHQRSVGADQREPNLSPRVENDRTRDLIIDKRGVRTRIVHVVE
jgi:hypothetical protein